MPHTGYLLVEADSDNPSVRLGIFDKGIPAPVLVILAIIIGSLILGVICVLVGWRP